MSTWQSYIARPTGLAMVPGTWDQIPGRETWDQGPEPGTWDQGPGPGTETKDMVPRNMAPYGHARWLCHMEACQN